MNVPADLRPHLNRREVVRSLRTADKVEARLRASVWEATVYRLFAHLRSNARYMDREQIEVLVAQTLDAELHEVEERLTLDAWRVNGPEWNEIARQVLADKYAELHEALSENDLTGTLEDARRMAPELSEASQRILARRLLEVKIEACAAEMAALEGKPLKRAVIAPRKPSEEPKKATAPLLSELARMYAEAKAAGGKWGTKTEFLVKSRLQTVVELLGDKPSHLITTADMRALQVALPRVPSNYRKVYAGAMAPEAIARADVDRRGERLSAKSCNMHIVDIKALFAWALKQELLEKSPAVALEELKDDAEERKHFTDADLALIFGGLKEDSKGDAARWWVPHILLYMQCRPSLDTV